MFILKTPLIVINTLFVLAGFFLVGTFLLYRKHIKRELQRFSWHKLRVKKSKMVNIETVPTGKNSDSINADTICTLLNEKLPEDREALGKVITEYLSEKHSKLHINTLPHGEHLSVAWYAENKNYRIVRIEGKGEIKDIWKVIEKT